MKSELDIAFKEAFDKVSKLQEAVAPDVMLKFYAYYKKATSGKVFSYDNKSNIRSAFKVNARMQIKDMSSKKAKEEYIKLANTILTNK